MKKNNFIISNFKKNCLLYSSNGDYSFIEPVPMGYKRVGIIPKIVEGGYMPHLPREEQYHFNNGFNICKFVIVEEIDGCAIASKPSKYQQKLIKKALLEMQEEPEEEEKTEENNFSPELVNNNPDITNDDDDIWV